MHRPTASILPLTLALAACVGDDPESPDGIDSGWRIDPEPVVAIGQVKGPPEYLFGSITSVRISPAGDIIVADRQAGSVRVFDREGRFVRQLGGSGEGPGEFRDVAGIWLSPPDTVHVLDLRLRRIASFTLAGEVLGIDRLQPGWRMVADHYLGSFADGSFLVGTGGGFVETVDANVVASEQNFWHYGAGGEYLGHFTGLPGRWWYTPTSGGGAAAVPTGLPAGGVHALSPSPRLVVHGDSMYFPDQVEPAVRVLARGGKVVRSIPLPPSGLSEEQARGLVRQALQAEGNERRLSRLEVMPRLSRIPQVFGLLVDGDGLIWTKPYEPARDHSGTYAFSRRQGQGGVWWVVDRTGRLRETLRMPDRFLPMAVADSLLVGIAVDELEVERVVVHRLRRDR